MKGMKFPIALRFAALSFLCVLAMSLTMGFALSSLLTRAVSQWEWENTAAFIQREVRLAGVDALFTAPQGPETLAHWSREVPRLFTGVPEVVRVKVWDRQATVLWSDEQHLIGQRFPDNEELREALGGEVAVEIKEATKSEHVYERREFRTLAEIYVPIFSKESGEVLGVLEVYKNPLRLLATIRWGRIVVWTISLSGGLTLYLILLPLVRGVYGREVREETLRVHAQRLEQEVAERTAELQREREAHYQSEKVAVMGSLLASVAHELNNPLAVVVGQATLLSQAVKHGTLAERAEKITNAAERCARIVRNFLSLIRQRPPERQEVQLNQVVVEALDLLAYALRVDTVEVTLDLGTDLPLLWADPNQLHQVVVNLISNADQAMREAPPPRQLTLATRYDADRGRVALKVADSGPGIPPELEGRIFEPFFTTKPVGQGTGLGLSLCQGIVEGHGGVIRVESQPGRGATFVVELPAGVLPVRTEARQTEAAPPVRGKSILVVDDEAEVAEVLTDMLAADGHHVETAANGLSALDKLRARTYDLIFSDLRMPELDGPGLYRELERCYPQLVQRMIFLTGDTLHTGSGEFLERTAAPCLAKPFDLDQVRMVVHQTLEPRGADRAPTSVLAST